MTGNQLDKNKTIISSILLTRNLATIYTNLDLGRLPQKLELVWKVTQPGINKDLTCQHINGE